jgi:hypothetical protein
MTNYLERAINYDYQPILDSIDFIYEKLNTNSELQSREIDSLTKTTSFFDYLTLGDLMKREMKYKSPVICVTIGQRIDETQDSRSSKRNIDSVIMIDSAIAAKTRRNAMRESIKFNENICQIIDSNKRNGRMLITVASRIIINPYLNHESLEEVAIRTIAEVKFQ